MSRILPPRSEILVELTPIERLAEGLKTCIELSLYRDGHAGVAVSRVEGKPRSRRVVQVDSLPLNHVQELRNHLMAIVDRMEEELDRSAESPVEQINMLLQSRLQREGLNEVAAVEGARWLDVAGILRDSPSRPGLPLRNLLRAGQIVGADQRPPQKHGSWFIVQVR